MKIAGVLFDASGPLPGVDIELKAEKTTLNGVIAGSRYVFTTDADGSYSISIEAGYYIARWNGNGRRILLGALKADEYGEMSLPESIGASATPSDVEAAVDFISDALVEIRAALDSSGSIQLSIEQSRDQALSARDAVSADRAEAELLASQAGKNAQDAQTASADSHLAKDQALAAKNAAQSAAQSTSADLDAVTSATAQVASDANDAQVARTGAESAEGSARALRDETQDIRDAAQRDWDQSKIGAVGNRLNQLIRRVDEVDEVSLVQYELVKVHEASRQASESIINSRLDALEVLP